MKNTWNLSSPRAVMRVCVTNNETTGLSVSAWRGNTKVLEEGAAGLRTSAADFTSGLVYQDETAQAYDETYTLPAGKTSCYHHESNELSIRFQKDVFTFTVVLRAFDDGIAYQLRIAGESQLLVHEEPSVLIPTADFKDSWLQKLVNTYEAPFDHNVLQKGEAYGMPSLFYSKENETWILLTEAGLLNTQGGYCSCHFVGGESNAMHIAFAPEEKGPLHTSLPLSTPWRVAMVAPTLTALVDSRLVFHLNPPSSLQDTSWIQPARSIWSWWSFENGAQLYTEQKKYVDFAAAYGFESITVDAGWDDTWVADLCSYAKKRNVSVWLWSDMQSLATVETAKPKIEKWAKWGVCGLKVDFFMNDSRLTMWQYNMIERLMTENKLMINFHGNTKPGGEGRTFPNLMTEEGIMGLEHYKWSDMPQAIHNCTVPFTRNVLGSMDYTPTGFTNGNRNTTQAHQLALSVVFESGVLHFAESIHTLLPWCGTDFLRRTYAVYDEMCLLDGFPGEHVAMLRCKNGEFFVGGISVQSHKFELPLNFLAPGEYVAELYTDDENGVLKKQSVSITGGQIFTHTSLAGGGFALYISKEIKPLRTLLCTGYMAKPFAVLPAEANGFYPIIAKAGVYTLRLVYAANAPCTVKIKTSANTQTYPLESSGGEHILRVADQSVCLAENETINIVAAHACIDHIELLDNLAPRETYYLAKDAICEGSATVMPVLGGEGVSVQQIGAEGALLFENVLAEEDGEYVLAMDYYAGENRPMLISVNNAEPIRSVLFNSGGWVVGCWNILGRKEVLVSLKKGVNSIRLTGEAEGAPHMHALAVFKKEEMPI